MEDYLKDSTWKNELKNTLLSESFSRLTSFLEEAYSQEKIFPKKEHIFESLNLTPLDQVKVLILGQDPYHGENQANGLAFSVNKGVKIPPSLKNIFKELQEDVGCPIQDHGCLKSWAKQGVLLLNTVLTVRAHQANAHQNKGWELFTDEIIKIVNKKNRPIVIFLWGKPAQKKKALLTNPDHLILEAPHPSPLSAYRGFLGCKHFSKCNAFLESKGLDPIDWEI